MRKTAVCLASVLVAGTLAVAQKKEIRKPDLTIEAFPKGPTVTISEDQTANTWDETSGALLLSLDFGDCGIDGAPICNMPTPARSTFKNVVERP